MEIKNRLLEIRLSMGYKTQGEFAKLLEIQQPRYCMYESNQAQPSLKRAFEIAEKLNKDINDIFYKEES